MIVGVIGDTHIPFAHPGYLPFVKRVFKQFRVKRVVHIGDLFDNHAISYHEADPDGYSSGDELSIGELDLSMWIKAFPRLDLLMGNHDKLPERKVKTAGLSSRFLKGFKETWGLPDGWVIHPDHVVIDGVYYTHGTGMSGKNAAINLSMIKGMSAVMGHIHS